MTLTPLIAVHITTATAAVVLGPMVFWTRRGHSAHPAPPPRTRLHRALGYAWVTLMLMTAISAIFIRDFGLPNIAGYTPVHLLIPVVFGTLFLAFRALLRGRVLTHRRMMLGLYISACLVAGAFTLLPDRYLGNLLWHHWLGLA
jgi:uncharacterized membrane protein